MKLYSYASSGNAYKVELALAQLGIPCDRIEVEIFRGEGQTPDYLRRNPTGRVPMLELDDGTCIVESNAILWHLARGSRLVPAGALAQTQVLSWMFFEQNEVEPVLGSARFWKLTGRDRGREDELERRIAQGRRSLSVLETSLATRSFLVDDVYSIADIALYAYTHLAGDVGIDLASYPAVSRWCASIEAQDRFFTGPGPYTAAALV